MITKNKNGFYSCEIGIVVQCIRVVQQKYKFKFDRFTKVERE